MPSTHARLLTSLPSTLLQPLRAMAVVAVLLAPGCGKKPEVSPRQVQNKDPQPADKDSRRDGDPKPKPPEKPPADYEPAVPGPALSPSAYVRTPMIKKVQNSWTIETEKSLPVGDNGLQFTSDGQLQILPELSPWVRWDFSRDTLAAAPFEGKYTTLAADGKSALRVEGAALQLLNAAGEAVAPLMGPKAAPQWTAFSPDGKVLATGGESGLWLWDRTGAQLRVSEKKFPDFASATFAPDSKTVAFVQNVPPGKAVLSLLPVETARVERSIDLDVFLQSGTLSWSPDGKRLAAIDWESRLVLIELPAGKVTYTETKDLGPNARPAWMGDSQSLVVARKDFSLVLLDGAGGKVLRTFLGHKANVNALALAADGKTLVSASADRSVRFWNLDTGTLRATLLLLPDGKWFAVSPGGHFKGSPKCEEHLVYQVERKKDKRVTEYHHLEFANDFGWVNKPEEVRLSPR